MGTNRMGQIRGINADSLTAFLTENPLDLIAEDHMREREICAMIDALVEAAKSEPDTCEQVLSFLKYQLPQHLMDEEIDLFPMMAKRCKPEDEIEQVITRLHADHRHAQSDTPRVIEWLEAASKTGQLSKRARKALDDYATHARKHLAIENAIVLPIARVRLTKRDFAVMKQHMLTRRGLDRLLKEPKC